MEIASFTPSLLITYDFLYSKEHFLRNTIQCKHTGIWETYHRDFCFLVVWVYLLDTNKMTINIMHQ